MIDRALGERYTCEFASNVEQAREKLSAATFHLALCDIQMPGESGLALSAEIVKEHPDTAVVLITGEDSPEVAAQAFDFGVHGYLVKPFWPGQLLITTMNALRRRELEIAERTRNRARLHSAKAQTTQLRGELAAIQQKAIDDLRASQQETVERLAKAIEFRDSSTGLHVNRMAVIAAFLGTQLQLDSDHIHLLRAAAPMHDVGKIATPDEILSKPGPLTDDERKEMERHTVIGHEILADSESELLRIAATIALTHHERFDGSGYPQGLVGEEIPLEGRIAAVADVFDALLSDRCYRPALPVEEAVELMTKGRGTQFDPQIADVLLEHKEEVLAFRDLI